MTVLFGLKSISINLLDGSNGLFDSHSLYNPKQQNNNTKIP